MGDAMDNLTRRKYLALMSATPTIMGLGLAGCGADEPPPPGRSSVETGQAEGRFVAVVDQTLTDEELLQIHLDVISGEAGGMRASDTYSFEDRQFDDELRKHIRGDRVLPAIGSGAITATAVPDLESADYTHIADLGSDATFELTHEVMRSLFTANSFEDALSSGLSSHGPNQQRVIFGLRGCVVADADQLNQPLQTIVLKEAAIDHLEMRCTMGVWDRENQTVSAYTASTVPHLSYMQLYRAYLHLKGEIVVNDGAITPEDKIDEEDQHKQLDNWFTNQLGQGLHLMTFGTHAGSKESLLTQHLDWYGPVQRARNELGYRIGDWDPSSTRVGDNIHPTWAFQGIEFASAGCNLIEGSGASWPYTGQIKTFLEEVAGVAGPTGTYAYALMTGREARLHAESLGDPSLRRVRFGSSGPDVLAIQQSGRLLQDIPASGLFDRSMHYAVIEMQQFEGLATDGILKVDAA